MTEEERWLKVRQIVREENDSLLARIENLLAAGASRMKAKIECVNGRWIGVTEAQMQAWKDAYPAVEIDSELKKMAAWIVSNPMLAPKTQLGRFVNSWLTKSQNQLSLRSIPTERPTAITPSLCEYCRRPATGAVSGRRACADHFQDAMDGIKPARFMPGVVAKPVAGS